MKRLMVAVLMSVCLAGAAFAQGPADVKAAKQFVYITMSSQGSSELRFLPVSDPKRVQAVDAAFVANADDLGEPGGLIQTAILSDPGLATCVQGLQAKWKTPGVFVTAIAKHMVAVEPGIWVRGVRGLELALIGLKDKAEAERLVAKDFGSHDAYKALMARAIPAYQVASTMGLTAFLKTEIETCKGSSSLPAERSAKSLGVQCSGNTRVYQVTPPAAGETQWTLHYSSPTTGSSTKKVSPSTRAWGDCRLNWVY